MCVKIYNIKICSEKKNSIGNYKMDVTDSSLFFGQPGCLKSATEHFFFVKKIFLFLIEPIKEEK